MYYDGQKNGNILQDAVSEHIRTDNPLYVARASFYPQGFWARTFLKGLIGMPIALTYEESVGIHFINLLFYNCESTQYACFIPLKDIKSITILPPVLFESPIVIRALHLKKFYIEIYKPYLFRKPQPFDDGGYSVFMEKLKELKRTLHRF